MCQRIRPPSVLLAAWVLAAVGALSSAAADAKEERLHHRAASAQRQSNPIQFSSPAMHAYRKFHEIVLLRADRKFTRMEAAISGVIDKWLEIPNYARTQTLLAGLSYKRILGWTSSGFDLEHFDSVWFLELNDGRKLLVWADEETIVTALLPRGQRKRVESLRDRMNKFVDTTQIQGNANRLGGTVTVLMVGELKNKRFLYSFGFQNDEKWRPLLRSRKAVRKLIGELINKKMSGDKQ